MDKFIAQSGQQMYFKKKLAREMIERENNPDHILVSKIFASVLLVEFGKQEGLKVADLGAGAHTTRYSRFLEYLQRTGGEIYWVDQSPIMLDYARKNVPAELAAMFQFRQAEMAAFLREHRSYFNGLILKYSLNYVLSITLAECLR